MHETTPAQFRAHATTPAGAERLPTMLCVASLSGRGVHHRLGVTRDPAAEVIGSSLFTGDVLTLSVSAHDKEGPVDAYFPEVFQSLERLLGDGITAMLREVELTSSSVRYFYLLADGPTFTAPSPLQDAYLARERNARPVR